jgi:hypothetical protein
MADLNRLLDNPGGPVDAPLEPDVYRSRGFQLAGTGTAFDSIVAMRSTALT